MDSELGEERGNLISSESDNDYGLVGGTTNAASPLSLADIFDKACPHYLAMGMTYDEYWNGDPWAVRAYRTAYKEKREADAFNAWLNGLYVRDAITACFSGKKNKFKYPERPYEIFADSSPRQETPKREQPRTAEEKKREKSDLAFNAFMMKWMSEVNKKYDGKEVEADGRDDTA